MKHRENEEHGEPLGLEAALVAQALEVEKARIRWRAALDRLNGLEEQMLTRPGWTRETLHAIYREHDLL